MTTELILLPVGAPDALPTDALTPDDKVRRLLDDFLAGLKPNTLRTYRQGLADFASFVGAGDARHAAATPLAGGHGEANHLGLAYRANMVERDLSANTINNRLAALRSLVKLARTLGMIG
jgi:integrase/recombinase XerC